MNDLPKILAISLNTWRSDSGAHTQTDLFKFWDKERLAQIYAKSDLPNTPVCDKFFQISENLIIKSVFNRRPVGRIVENTETMSGADAVAAQKEKNLYERAHKKKSWFWTLVREIVWSLGRWKSKKLDEFIEEYDPDVYFVPVYPVGYMGKIQRYIIKKHPRPFVCYLADDNYSYKPCGKNPFALLHRFFLRRQVKYLAKNCTEMFTITKTEAEDTDKLFGTHSVVLTKGLDYTGLEYRPIKTDMPIKMVYTGNLLIGRASSLVAISKALAEINREETKIKFDIYSTTKLDKKATAALNSNGCEIHEPVAREKVFEIQQNADVLVFAESLEKAHRYDARLSFSTKLTDYFKSGKCIFAIGDESIAPIRYLKENDAAIIATDTDEITLRLKDIADKEGLIDEYGRKAFECGKRNHEESNVKRVLIETFLRAVGNDVSDESEVNSPDSI